MIILAGLPASILRLSRARRRAYTALAFVVYALAYYPLFLAIRSTVAVIGLVPVVVSGLFLGPWAGMAAALVCLIVTTGFYVQLGFDVASTLPRTIPAHLVYGLVGAVVGAVRRTALALRDERARLERSRALLLTAERMARMGSWETNLATGQSIWSDGAYHNLGLEPGSAIPSQETGMKAIHPGDRERVERALRTTYAERKPLEIEFRVVRPGGGVATISSRTEFITDPDGVTRAIGVGWDVTDRRDLEARVFLSDRLTSLGTLAGGVAHEINNPLAVVAANVDYATGELDRAEDGRIGDLDGARAALSEARDGTRRIAAIVGDLRTFARGDEEKLAPTDVNRVAQSALSLARNELRHRATVVQELGDVPPVIADEARLGQVLVNLLVNAAHSLPEGDAARQRITVSTRVAGERVEIDVADTGRGIAPEARSRVFDPFFTTKSPGIGMGLGLAICHGIVHRLGGELSVAATEVGAGTTMRVTLPPAPRAASAPLCPAPVAAAASPVAAARRRARVLVVDDEELLLQAIRRSLGNQHDIELAGSGRRALELLATRRYDVILCDLLMPEVSGMDVHAALRERAPELADRMVFMTGGAFTPRAQEFLESVPNARVDKPVSTATLSKLFAERAGGDA